MKLTWDKIMEVYSSDDDFTFSGVNFDGSISGVKIYNRALSDDEIKLLYEKGMY
jgi:hypothetical protein